MLQIDPLVRKFPKQIKPLDMEAIFHVDDDTLRRKLEAYGPDLEDLLGVGSTSFAEKGPAGPAVTVEVVDRRDTYQACARSWKRRADVGQDPDYPDLSLRDAQAVLQPAFDGRAIAPARNPNSSELDDPAVNAAIDRALALPPGGARDAAWADVNRLVVGTAAAIPYQWDKTVAAASGDVAAVLNVANAAYDLNYTSLK